MRDSEKPWLDHLEELRRRIIVCLAALTGFFVLGLVLNQSLIRILTGPLAGLSAPLYFTAPAEGFLVALKASLFFAAFATLPVFVYELWRFVKPGLEEKEHRIVALLFLASAILFVGGSLFCYFLVLPTALKFLLGFGSVQFRPLLSVDHYSSFVGFMVLGFGLSFNFPLVLIGLAIANIATAAWLRHQRKFVILGIFILSAILTPSPDVFSQLLMAAPLLVLFELTILVMALLEKNRNKGISPDFKTT